MEIALRSHCLSAGSTPEAGQASDEFQQLQHNPPTDMPRWSSKWAQHAMGVLDIVSLSVSHDLDRICELVQEPANSLGAAMSSMDKSLLASVGLKVARSHPLHVVFVLIRKLQSECRKFAGLCPWGVLSTASDGRKAHGRVIVAKLSDMQGQSAVTGSGENVVVFSEEVSGAEDIPQGVEAVLTASTVDPLCHTAMCARKAHVLFLSCADLETFKQVAARNDKQFVAITAGPVPGDVTIVHRIDEDTTDEDEADDELLRQARLELRQARQELRQAWTSKYGEVPDALQAPEGSAEASHSKKKKGWFFGFGRS